MKLFEERKVTGKDGKEWTLHFPTLDTASIYLKQMENESTRWLGKGRLTVAFDMSTATVAWDKRDETISGLTFGLYVREARFDPKTRKGVTVPLTPDHEKKIEDYIKQFNAEHSEAYIGISKIQTKKDGTELSGRRLYMIVPFDNKALFQSVISKGVDINQDFSAEEAENLLREHIEQYMNKVSSIAEEFAEGLSDLLKNQNRDARQPKVEDIEK